MRINNGTARTVRRRSDLASSGLKQSWMAQWLCVIKQDEDCKHKPCFLSNIQCSQQSLALQRASWWGAGECELTSEIANEMTKRPIKDMEGELRINGGRLIMVGLP